MREQADYELRAKPLEWSKVYSQVLSSRNLIQREINSVPEAEFRRLGLPRG